MVTKVERRGGAEHRPHHARHLGHRLALHAQGHDERRNLRRRCIAVQDLGHDGFGLFGRQLDRIGERTQDARPPTELIERHRVIQRDQASSRKSISSSAIEASPRRASWR